LELREILDDLIRLNGTFYRHLCAKYVPACGRVEECLQDGFRKFLESGRSFDDLKEAEKFLCRLLINHFIDVYREDVTRRKRQSTFPDNPAVIPSGRTGPEERLLERQQEGFRRRVVGELCRRLERLPARQRELLYLTFLKEPPMSLREISEMKRIPLTTVHSRLRGAMSVLRTRSADLLQEWENYF
jgi:RNA polymerase sigma factor (sigma-70 family)